MADPSVPRRDESRPVPQGSLSAGKGGYGTLYDNSVGALVRLLNPQYRQDGGYSPQQWEEWYSKSPQRGTQEFVAHQDFLHRAQPVLRQRWQEYLDANPDRLPSAGEQQAAQDAILGNRFQPTPVVLALRDDFLNWMQKTALYGSDQPDVSITPETYREWQNDPSMWRRINVNQRLSPAGVEAYGKLKDYNLLTAFQDSPQHSPSAMAQPALNLPFAMAGALYAKTVGSAEGDRLSQSQLTAGNLNPSPLNAVRYAMDWRRRAEAGPEDQVRDYRSGARVPQASAQDPFGQNKTFYSGDTSYGAATTAIDALFKMPLESFDNVAAFANAHSNLTKTTPVLPESERAGYRDMREAVENMYQENRDRPAAYMPMLLRSLGLQPAYGTRATNVLANLTGDVMDPITLATVPLFGPAAVMGDLPGEFLFSGAVEHASAPKTAGVGDYLYTRPNLPGVDPYSETYAGVHIPLRTPDGRIPRPDMPEYDDAVKAFEQERSGFFDTLRDAGYARSSVPEVSLPPAPSSSQPALSGLLDEADNAETGLFGDRRRPPANQLIGSQWGAKELWGRNRNGNIGESLMKP